METQNVCECHVFFCLLTKLTSLTLHRNLWRSVKISLCHISDFSIFTSQSPRAGFTRFMDLTCSVSAICCPELWSYKSALQNVLTLLLWTCGHTQWLNHLAQKTEGSSEHFIKIKSIHSLQYQCRKENLEDGELFLNPSTNRLHFKKTPYRQNKNICLL